MLRPREVGAAEFKARCLELMNEVERLGTEIIITKHRKPVARLVPAHPASPRFCGALAGMVLEEHDLVSPIDVVWEADESNFT
jgi:prevent-host-death family protein